MIMLAGLILGKSHWLVPRGLGKTLETTDTKNESTSYLAFIALGVAMMLINWGLSYPVWAFTLAGQMV
ncbi:MAG: hypothetical protein V4610_22810 [Pseudomonadota bacterium]|jgi:hypothetical protein